MKNSRNENGQSMVEFAIAFIFLMFFLVAIIEFSWYIGNEIMATNAAREGARYAAVHHKELAPGEGNIELNALVENAIALGNRSSAKVNLQFTPADSVTVSITYDAHHMTGLFDNVGMYKGIVPQKEYKISSKSIMRKE